MNVQVISATYARNNFFEVLDRVAEGMPFDIKKDEKVVARIEPYTDVVGWKTDRDQLLRTVKQTRGLWGKAEFVSPLRGKAAAKWVTRWDEKK